MNNCKNLFIVFYLLFVGVLSVHAEEARFSDVVKEKIFDFPKDLGAHLEYKTEWWYFTGHLTSSQQQTFGFELVFFRIGVLPGKTVSKSAWKTDSIYLGHFALTDDAKQKFYNFERSSRGVFDESGASDDRLNVWLKDWKVEQEGQQIRLFAKEKEIELSLRLKPKKNIVLHGKNGLSQKGPEPGQASYYNSYTRLEGGGELKVGGENYIIDKASAWFDQEYTSSELARGILGWDWFAIQLDNNTEIMLYQLRDKDGNVSEFSKGTLIFPDGRSESISRNDFKIEVLDFWKSDKSQTRYPARWRISVPKLTLNIEVNPTVKEQELITEGSTNKTYWEGRAVVSDVKSQQRVGNAYVELVGY